MTAIEVLDKYDIHETRLRLKILDTLMNNECLTCAEIIRRVNLSKSRTSILRILAGFIKAGIVQTRLSIGEDQKFFFSESDLSRRLYFACDECQRLFIFKIPDQNQIYIPGHFQAKTIIWNIRGLCSDCNTAKKTDFLPGKN